VPLLISGRWSFFNQQAFGEGQGVIANIAMGDKVQGTIVG